MFGRTRPGGKLDFISSTNVRESSDYCKVCDTNKPIHVSGIDSRYKVCTDCFRILFFCNETTAKEVENSFLNLDEYLEFMRTVKLLMVGK
jgi:hypothetical protein